MSKTIIVTGSSGFVGSYLVRALRKCNYKLIELDLKNGFELTDWEKVRKIKEFDVLIHLAARVFVPDSYQSPRDFYYNNIVSTMNVLELCKLKNAKMIYASSYVYGNPKYLPIDEKHPVSALNPYTESKVICERLCKSYHSNFKVPVIIFRPFNIYGKGQNENFLIPIILKQINKTGKIKLKDSRPKRDFIYIDDAVNAYVKAIEFHTKNVGIFNLGSGMSFSVKEVAEMIANNFCSDIQIEFSEERRKNEILDTVADITKANKLLGWKPDIRLKDGLTLCVSEYGEKKNNERR